MTMSNVNDVRAGTARYYDIFQSWTSDIRYYLGLVGELDSVLELGCGTGRVLVALAERARRVVGIDHSQDMLTACKRKLAAMGLLDKAALVADDITNSRLNERFHHVLAPFNVLQNLTDDAEVDGMLGTIRAHLLPRGTAILTAIAPACEADELARRMHRRAEKRLVGQAFVEDRLVRRYETIERTVEEPLVVWVKQEYECYSGGRLVDRASMIHPIRMWYPEDIEAKIEAAGLRVTHKEGGYNGEVYGNGGTLVLHVRVADGLGA